MEAFVSDGEQQIAEVLRLFWIPIIWWNEIQSLNFLKLIKPNILVTIHVRFPPSDYPH